MNCHGGALLVLLFVNYRVGRLRLVVYKTLNVNNKLK